jgi:hypothetical protein
MIQNFMGVELSGRSRDDVLGPPLARVQTKFAKPGPAMPASAFGTMRAILRSVRLLAGWWLTRSGFKSPFFDKASQAPRATPRVLSAEERRALDRAARG